LGDSVFMVVRIKIMALAFAIVHVLDDLYADMVF
jgi:hypothetical protein